jgi:hypothetical protein
MPRRLVPMTLCFLHRGSKVKSDSLYSFQFNEMARLEGLEPPTLCYTGRSPPPSGTTQISYFPRKYRVFGRNAEPWKWPHFRFALWFGRSSGLVQALFESSSSPSSFTKVSRIYRLRLIPARFGARVCGITRAAPGNRSRSVLFVAPTCLER